MPEPLSITAARYAIRRYEETGLCPLVAERQDTAPWTCPECNKLIPALRDAKGFRYGIKCPLAKEGRR